MAKDEDKKPSELAELLIAPFTMVSFKSSLLLFMIFLFISSNIFIDQFLSTFKDVQSGGQISNKGIIIQGIFLVLFYALAQVVIGFDLI